MNEEIDIEGLRGLCIPGGNSSKVAYLIYPAVMPFNSEWLREMASKYGVSLVVVYIPAYGWNDMLTPWPEPGETPDSPPFAGQAGKTLEIIAEKVIPQAEKTLGATVDVSRNLIGVSLSGLFTLWQWMRCPLFDSIAALSGSFWYHGFIEWFEKQTIPRKSGKAFFLLGDKEPKAWIKAYRSVGVNTQKIITLLRGAGIDTEFVSVPGNHYAEPIPRVEKAFEALYVDNNR